MPPNLLLTPCLEGLMKIDRRRFLGYAGASLTATQLTACGFKLVRTAANQLSSR